MGILDDAIKEHLELKRAHGADAAELKQLEDEAFGAAERPGDEESAPDPAAEAPTEFMQQPDLEAPGADEEATGRPALRSEIADLQEAPPPAEPAEEEAPAMEHEAIAEPEPPAAVEPPAPAEEPAPPTGPTTEEREAIAEQPTEMYDIEEELAAAAPEAEAEQELVDKEEDGGDEATYEDEEDDDFWDEKRLSDELDQALEAPIEIEEEAPAEEPAPVPEDLREPEEPEDAPPAAPEPAPDEDVLEETPDFLEEAPEDDQLWFEQKPPKDFDFDD